MLLGTLNWRYCILSHLGMWLELQFGLNPNDNNRFVFGAKGKSDPNSIKNSIACHLFNS